MQQLVRRVTLLRREITKFPTYGEVVKKIIRQYPAGSPSAHRKAELWGASHVMLAAARESLGLHQ